MRSLFRAATCSTNDYSILDLNIFYCARTRMCMQVRYTHVDIPHGCHHTHVRNALNTCRVFPLHMFYPTAKPSQCNVELLHSKCRILTVLGDGL